MAEVVTVAEVQQWLEATKLHIGTVDDELHATAREIVFSRASRVYTVTTWVDVATTPSLIRKLVAMLIASYTYRRQYSEAIGTEDNNYADWLDRQVELILSGIVDSTIDLTDVATEASSASGPAYLPNASTGYTQVYDASGNPVGDQYSEDIKFRMGTRF